MGPPPQDYRRVPVRDEEIVRRLNELLEVERAGVEAAAALRRTETAGLTAAEVKKFGDDEAWACAGLNQAILRYGGVPSDLTGDFGRRVAALENQGERLSLMARGQAWVVKRLDAVLAMPLEEETRAFLAEMREQHLENIEACNRGGEEVSAPPSPPYRGLPFASLRETHDRLYYGSWRTAGAPADEEIPPQPGLHTSPAGWRGAAATEREYQRAYFRLGRYLSALAEEVQRSRSLQARRSLTKARKAYANADPQVHGDEAIRNLDNALSYAHSALNGLLRQSRVPPHDPADFERHYDVVGIPFREAI
ncbi:MAG: hypothetical protein HY575_08430 [candidate division NC10 bacterium]|nr:hypothetical protein [candidate division NC10 bacterium]